MISPIDSFMETIFLRICRNYPVKASLFFLRRAETLVALIRRAFMIPSIVRVGTTFKAGFGRKSFQIFKN